jgi:hypothetical protein
VISLHDPDFLLRQPVQLVNQAVDFAVDGVDAKDTDKNHHPIPVADGTFAGGFYAGFIESVWLRVYDSKRCPWV